MGAQAHRRPSVPRHPSIVPSDCGDVEEEHPWEDVADTVDSESVQDEVMAVEAAVAAAASTTVPPSALYPHRSTSNTRPTLTRAALSSLNLTVDGIRHASSKGIKPSIEQTPLQKYLSNFLPTSGVQGLEYFGTADMKPLISVSSLKELEVENFMVNPKLRHDMNFERDLRYRPNKEGPEAALKSKHENQYWTAIEVEMEWYGFFLMYNDIVNAPKAVADEWLSEFRARQRRLPGMFRTMKSIVLSMTPQHEVSWVKDALDVDLIMQEIEKGQFDMNSFAMWIASWMKSHCAPIRDQYVDMMVKKAAVISASGGKPSSVVEILRALFLMLENMKLDVANHQIVQLRPKMLKSFTHFERGFYLDQISRGHFEYEPMLPWYLQRKPSAQLTNIPISPEQRNVESVPPNLRIFVNKYISSLLYPIQYSSPISSSTENRLGLDFPPSFEHDRDRLELLHQDLHSLIYTDICLLKISSMLHMNRVPDQAPQVIEIALRTFRVILWDIVQNENEPMSRNPRGTSSSTGQLPYPTLPIPLSRWIHSSIGNIAVEMVRCVVSVFSSEMCRYKRLSEPQKLPESIIDEKVTKTEAWLRQNLQSNSGLFQQRKAALKQRLSERVIDGVNTLRTMNPLAVFQRLVPNGSHAYSSMPRPGSLGSVSVAAASRILNSSASSCSTSAATTSSPSNITPSPMSGPASRAVSFSSPTRPRAFTPGAASIMEDKKRRVFDATMRLHNAHANSSGALYMKTAGDAVFEGVLRRIAHIAVLHWWVWSPIIYFEDSNNNAPSTDAAEGPSTLTDAQKQQQEDKRRASEALERKRRRVFSKENEEAVLFLDDFPEGEAGALSDIDEHAIIIDEKDVDDGMLGPLIDGVVGKNPMALVTACETAAAKAAAISSVVVMETDQTCKEVDEAMKLMNFRVQVRSKEVTGEEDEDEGSDEDNQIAPDVVPALPSSSSSRCPRRQEANLNSSGVGGTQKKRKEST